MTQKLFFSNIDDLIGDEKTRYFGSGYKKVKYQIEDEKTQDDFFLAQLKIHYPDDWSLKVDGKKLQPHLSTLDSVVIGVKLVKDYMNKVLNIDEGIIVKSLINNFTVKAGKTLYENLSDINAKLKFNSENQISDNLLDFSIKIAQFSVKIEVVLPISLEQENVESKSEKDYYFHEFTNTVKIIKNIELSSDYTSITGKANLNYPLNITGIEANYVQENLVIPIIDEIIITAELTEALLSKLDNIPREKSTILLMRKVNCERSTNYLKYDQQLGLFKVSMRKTQVVSINGRIMRLSDMIVTAPNLYMTYSVAQELPKEMVVMK